MVVGMTESLLYAMIAIIASLTVVLGLLVNGDLVAGMLLIKLTVVCAIIIVAIALLTVIVQLVTPHMKKA